MDNYSLLLNEIKKFLEKEEIKEEGTNVKVISLYDLFLIVNEELKDLQNIMIDSKINKKIKISRLASAITGVNFYSRTTTIDNCACVYFFKERFDDDEICWSVEDELCVYKERNVDDLKISDEKNKYNKSFYNFIKRNYNLILDTLTKIEYYIKLLGSIHDTCEFFNNELFNVRLSFCESGRVSIDLYIKGDHPLKDEYYKNWYTKENIYSFVRKNQDEILKRIPISIYELIGGFKTLYEEHIKKQENTTKEKVKRR